MKSYAFLLHLLCVDLHATLALPKWCPHQCFCSKGTIDCSSRSLTAKTLPVGFPVNALELRLNDNKLTSVPSGLFDRLDELRAVSLEGNPWTCDCEILYLRAWLMKQENRTLYKTVACNSPDRLKGRLVMYLAEDEVQSTCQYGYCDVALVSQVILFVLIAVQAALLLLVILFLRRFQKISSEAKSTERETLHGESSNILYAQIKERASRH
ncbi:platelet glycoprotein Ib beta chain-like [Acipenser oxyrinchus oxyrinchus]|uniref:Platelet glycoprotein Ib beta chain-like n=1 Tax=Acipenser oxyrinchus oxyrinchus TaxID=40147 RepID=A0AAD8G1W6_ACIOX|nr:platelet glycoprotein Ib beta chain-like [Acipenser oxyrinchus oxyrinchus]